MNRKRIAAATLALATALSLGQLSAQATVTPTGAVMASASGSNSPTTTIEPLTTSNGEFTISGNTPGSIVGDGIDEQTDWILDFTPDPDLVALPASGTLAAASLVLTVTPGNANATDDGLRIGTLPVVSPTEFSALQAGVAETMTIDLLGLYSSHQILDTLDDNGGTIPMRYEDDAIVSFAELVLVVAGEEELFASDADVSELFGFSIAISDTTAVVGAPGAAGTGLPGKAYVFNHDGNGWIEQAILSATTPVAGEQFGYDVAIKEGTIVIGARGVGSTGSTYIFTGSGATWAQEAQLGSGSSGNTNDQFGTSVDIEGTQILIGAPTDSQLSGAAYIFEDSGSGWIETLKFGSQSSATGGLFGDAVLLDGGRAFVGAPIEASGSFSLAGSVYIHDASTGSHLQTLEPGDRQSFHGFGTSLTIDSGTLVVGANGDAGPVGFDPTCTGGTATCNPGSVYIYTESATGFSFDLELHASDLDLEANFSPGAQFGLETDLVGDTLVIGARYNDGRTSSIGKAHVFDREFGLWTPTVRLVASDSRQGDLLGNTVAIFGDSGDAFLIGVPNDDNANGLGSANEGAIYSFDGFVVESPICDGLEPTILGTPGDDVLIGTNSSDVIAGLGGNDIIQGGNGDDVICGGPGADQLDGENGQDLLLGGSGDDSLSGGNGKDSLDGGSGTDECDGGNGKDVQIGCE